MMKLKFLFLKILYEWASTSHALSAVNFLEFLDTMSFCYFIVG
jgi:hypothetical protein